VATSPRLHFSDADPLITLRWGRKNSGIAVNNVMVGKKKNCRGKGGKGARLRREGVKRDDGIND